jgi:hypothetical protein
MTKNEILELIKEAKELGLKSIKIGDISVEFNSVEETTKKAIENNLSGELEAKDLVAPPNKYDELTDEEILFWSSDYGYELEAARKKEQEDSIRRVTNDTFE